MRFTEHFPPISFSPASLGSTPAHHSSPSFRAVRKNQGIKAKQESKKNGDPGWVVLIAGGEKGIYVVGGGSSVAVVGEGWESQTDASGHPLLPPHQSSLLKHKLRLPVPESWSRAELSSRLEWRYYLRRSGTGERRKVAQVGRKTRVRRGAALPNVICHTHATTNQKFFLFLSPIPYLLSILSLATKCPSQV